MYMTKRHLVISGSILGLSCLLILGSVARKWYKKCMQKHSDNDIREKLRQSKTVLDKASSVIQSTLDEMEQVNLHKDS